MKLRILVSGLGGQGVLFLTRVLAEAAAAAGHEVITSETHGMAQRGGSVLSTVKVGPFHGPLIAAGEADVGLFLVAGNLPVHGHYLRPAGIAFVNAASKHFTAEGAGTAENDSSCVDAAALAAQAGSPHSANLALLGFAAGRGALFGGPADFEAAIRAVSPARFLEKNLQVFSAGVGAAR